MAWPNRHGLTKADLAKALAITKADLIAELAKMEKRITANADSAHEAIGKRLDRIDGRLQNLENKLLAPQERTP